MTVKIEINKILASIEWRLDKRLIKLTMDLILKTNHPESDAESTSLKEHYKRIELDLLKLADVVEDLKK